MGVSSAVSIAAGLGLGLLADGHWHTSPICAFVGLGVGVVGAVGTTWRQARKYL